MLKTLFQKDTDHTLIQLLRYTFVGGIAFCVDFGSLWGLTECFGLHYLTSATLAFLLGLATNYLLSVSWVFSRRRIDNKKVEFFVFGLIGVVGLGMNDLFIWVFTEYAGFHYLFSKIVSTVVVYLWNFFARKYVLFSSAFNKPTPTDP